MVADGPTLSKPRGECFVLFGCARGGGGQTSHIDPMANQHCPTFSDAEPKLFQHQ